MMNRLYQSLACFIMVLSVINIVDASFGYCVVNKYNNRGNRQQNIGAFVWNDAGNHGITVTVIPTSTSSLNVFDNNWGMELQGLSPYSAMPKISIRNPIYRFSVSNLPYQTAFNMFPIRFREEIKDAVFYECYSTGGSWCKNNMKKIADTCLKFVEIPNLQTEHRFGHVPEYFPTTR